MSGRHRGRNSTLSYRWENAGSSKSERLFCGNKIVDNALVSGENNNFDVFSSRNVSLRVRELGYAMRQFWPSPNRRSSKVTREYRKTNKKQTYVEGY